MDIFCHLIHASYQFLANKYELKTVLLRIFLSCILRVQSFRTLLSTSCSVHPEFWDGADTLGQQEKGVIWRDAWDPLEYL
jgi:hypothetical protein